MTSRGTPDSPMISLSVNPLDSASASSSFVSGPSFSRTSRSMRYLILSRNHGLIFVTSYTSSTVISSLLNTSAMQKIRSSSQAFSLASSSTSPRQDTDGVCRPSHLISTDVSAFSKALSKLLHKDMTSPVAFICVPSTRDAVLNLSKGQRGYFTTM